MQTTVHASSKRVDDRRNRRYGRSVTVSVTGIEPADVAGGAHYVLRRHTFAGSNKPLHAWGDDGRRYGDSRGGSVSVEFFAKVSRPSDIPDELTATRWAEAFVPEVVAIIKSLIVKRAEHERRERLARQATRIADHIGKQAREQAKDVVRYKQRLAALEAELEAEVEAQLRTEIAGIDDAIVEHNAEYPDDKFEPEAVEVAKREAHRFTGARGFMRVTPEIKVEQIPELPIKTFGVGGEA